MPSSLRVGGFVDAHVHLATEGAPLGVEVERLRKCGVTGIVEAGTSGAIDFTATVARWREQIPLRAFVNVVPTGLRGDRDRWEAPPADPLSFMDGIAPDGVKVRLGEPKATDDARDLANAKAAARALGVPLMVHVTNARVDPSALFGALDEGDIVTHCYCGGRFSIIDRTGRVHNAAYAGRARGIRFDVGRGLRHMDRDVAKAAFAQGFYPDFVSTDIVSIVREGLRAYDIAETIADVVSLGMPFEAAVAAASTAPAKFYDLPIPAPTARDYVEIFDDGRIEVVRASV